ncbi:hypothetical protein QUF76_04285 [Desulfobacterales bacterium HSG16]|nr:hypothetical protein [Desulfobacterales bacterium HSG16]
MLKKNEFVKFILEGQKTVSKPAKKEEPDSSLDVFDDFGFSSDETPDIETSNTSFARQLLEASGFGNAEFIERAEVILGDDPAARYLPDKAYYWPKSAKRPYQTLLFELEQNGRNLLKEKIFKQIKSNEILEDALSRLIQMALAGFARGGDKRTASVKGGKQSETVCVVSINDDRTDEEGPVHLVCLGTQSREENSLETFHIKEEAKTWEAQLARDYLICLYERHFSKLLSAKWQNAFVTGNERKLSRKLLEACTQARPDSNHIAKSIVALLEELAGSFGLKRKGGKTGRRLAPFDLIENHDIGMNAESIEKRGGKNPFQGMVIRDEGQRLLGYIIYCLENEKDAETLRKYLAKHNRFHNVLVIYPDEKQAFLELWQGSKALKGRLTKQGAKYEGEGEVVNLLSRFFVVSRSKVKNPVELARELAYRARYLRRLALLQFDEEKSGKGKLTELYKASTKALIADQTKEEFADACAQTLTYGLLSARWISRYEFVARSEHFTVEKALKFFPSTSPFLKDFFDAILKAKKGEFKLTWLLEDIADLLDRTDIGRVFKDEKASSGMGADPVIHFYEPFLTAYDAKTKKSRGVYYTPDPVVSFIVRSVDEVLRKEFGLKDGLADTSTWGDLVKKGIIERPEKMAPKGGAWKKLSKQPFVQILDPATGTGTFLKHTIALIYKTMSEKWLGQGKSSEEVKKLWNAYVPEHLLPRLFGFELMMAPYTVCHMKLGLALQETGYGLKNRQRINVFLTNALEEPHEYCELGELNDFVSKESEEADTRLSSF